METPSLSMIEGICAIGTVLACGDVRAKPASRLKC
jgi:hypothetical protein